MLVTASPDRADADETLHALRFGERCSHVENKASNATATMADVLKALDASLSACEKEIARLAKAGGKARAESDAAAMAGGQGMNDAALANKGAGLRGSKGYTVVEDVAGKYLAEVERLAVLTKRKKEIIGGGSTEGH